MSCFRSAGDVKFHSFANMQMKVLHLKKKKKQYKSSTVINLIGSYAVAFLADDVENFNPSKGFARS